MKKINSVLFVIFLCAILFCKEENSFSKINVGILSGPSCIPVCKMLENPKIKDAELNFEKFATPQNLLPKFIKKEIDIAFLPVNVAVKLFNTANKNIVCLAITGNGNIFLITTDKKINKLTDLNNKKVQVAGQGATPDFLFRYLLQQNEIDTEKNGIDLDFSVPNAQIVAQLISGKVDCAVVPEPFVTIAKTKSKKVYVAVDFQEEYKFFSDKKQNYPLTIMVAEKSFAQKNPQLIENFLQEYENSLKWTLKNNAAAGKLCQNLDFGLNANIVEKSIPNANYVFVRADSAKSIIEDFLRVFMQFDSSAIGEKFPSEDFYFNLKNASETEKNKDNKND